MVRRWHCLRDNSFVAAQGKLALETVALPVKVGGEADLSGRLNGNRTRAGRKVERDQKSALSPVAPIEENVVGSGFQPVLSEGQGLLGAAEISDR